MAHVALRLFEHMLPRVRRGQLMSLILTPAKVKLTKITALKGVPPHSQKETFSISGDVMLKLSLMSSFYQRGVLLLSEIFTRCNLLLRLMSNTGCHIFNAYNHSGNAATKNCM